MVYHCGASIRMTGRGDGVTGALGSWILRTASCDVPRRTMRPKKYTDSFVARVKGLMLLCGMPTKVAASFAGVNQFVCRAWREGKQRKDVAPDPAALIMVKEILHSVPKTCDSVVSGNLRSAQTLPAASGSETGRLG